MEVIGGLSGVQNLVAAKGANPSGCGFTCGKSMEGGKSSLASCSQEGGPETARGAPQVAPHRNSEKVDWIDLGLGCSCVTEWHRIFGLHVTLPIRPEGEKVAALQKLTALLAIFRICLLSMPQCVTGMSQGGGVI